MRAEIGKEMCDRAEKVFILSESSKSENVGLTTAAEFSKIDTDFGQRYSGKSY